MKKAVIYAVRILVVLSCVVSCSSEMAVDGDVKDLAFHAFDLCYLASPFDPHKEPMKKPMKYLGFEAMQGKKSMSGESALITCKATLELQSNAIYTLVEKNCGGDEAKGHQLVFYDQTGQLPNNAKKQGKKGQKIEIVGTVKLTKNDGRWMFTSGVIK